MTLAAIISVLEEFAPLRLQEKWDNSGLQIGLPPHSDGECTGALLCLDVTEATIAEAVERGCNLVISHHPLIFKGVKSLTGRDATQRTVAAAVRAGVAVYSSHTALDSTPGGVSYCMASLLGAMPFAPLSPADGGRVEVSITCPVDAVDDIRLALLDIEGVDSILSVAAKSSYLDVDSDGSFALGETPAQRLVLTLDSSRLRAVTSCLAGVPDGDLCAVAVTPLEGKSSTAGLGLIADFPEAITAGQLVERLKKAFGCSVVRTSLAYDPAVELRRIALCGGAGGEFIGNAAAAGAGAYITGDIRYHDFADMADENLILFDIGHFEGENCFKSIFYHVITNKFPNFAVYYAGAEKNPVKYL
ncbi:MAG: Nif3-like dinuclear metal center hexameric protein [Bacteroidales bacterium]|nr:Nif3-like dinuclear metal center hexameric protein [Bacteroidales bacterium]